MLDNYLGQDEAIAQLKVEIQSAKAGATRLPHMLFLGTPGTGKTTLARAVAEEMGLPFEVLHGPNASDRDSVSEKIVAAQGGILYVEEIHALPRLFAEDMFTVIDDSVVTLTSPVMEQKKKLYLDGIEIKSRTVLVPTDRYETARMKIDPVTVIGATTDEALLPEAFLSRLSGLVVRLQDYSVSDLANIAFRYVGETPGLVLSWDAAFLLAHCSRRNPRRLKQLVDRAFAEFIVNGEYSEITVEDARTAIERLGIDNYGLESPHRKLLSLLIAEPLSRTSLAQKMGIPAKNFDLYWAELMRLGMVTIGRKHEITDYGKEVING